MSEPPAADVLIAHDSGDLRSVELLGSALEGAGIRPQLLDQRAFDGAGGDPLAILNPVRVLVIAVGRQSVPDFLITLGQAAQRIERPPFLIMLGRAGDGTAEKFGLSGEGVFDYRSGVNESVVAGFVERVRWALGSLPEEAPTVEQSAAQQAPEPNIPPNISKMGPPLSPEPREYAIGDIWDALDNSALAVLAQADAVARRRKATEIHSEDLLIGLYREAGGPTVTLLREAGISERDVARMVSKRITSIRPGTALRRVRDLPFAPTFSRHGYAALVAAFDAANGEVPPSKIATRHLLYGLLSLPDCSVATQLRAATIAPRSSAPGVRPNPSPHVGDPGVGRVPLGHTGGPDLRNIGSEVDAIATVLRHGPSTRHSPSACSATGAPARRSSWTDLEQANRPVLESRGSRRSARRRPCLLPAHRPAQVQRLALHRREPVGKPRERDLRGPGRCPVAAQALREGDHRGGTRRADLILERAQAEQRLEAAGRGKPRPTVRLPRRRAKVDRVDGLYDELVEADLSPGGLCGAALKVALAQPEVADAIKDPTDKVDEAVVRGGRGAPVSSPTRSAERSRGAPPTTGYIGALLARRSTQRGRVWAAYRRPRTPGRHPDCLLSAAGLTSRRCFGFGSASWPAPPVHCSP